MAARLPLKVEYITSCAHSAGGVCIHFFQVSEKAPRPGSDRPSKRLLGLVDRATFHADMELALRRTFSISKIEALALTPEMVDPISRTSRTRYDELLQTTSMLDFVRSIACIFRPENTDDVVPLYEMEENQAIDPLVHCRPAFLTDEMNAKGQSEEASMRLQEVSRYELGRAHDELQKEREARVQDRIDMQMQIEELRHSLKQSEAMLRIAKQGTSTAESTAQAIRENTAVLRQLHSASPSSSSYNAAVRDVSRNPEPAFNVVPQYDLPSYGAASPPSSQGRARTAVNLYLNEPNHGNRLYQEFLT
ncbi:hypothetical protein DIPPA_26678 [Diplonema papillatum]|nr:hypothetical protein DIPPA_26678 [Diplonema papillatum]